MYMRRVLARPVYHDSDVGLRYVCVLPCFVETGAERQLQVQVLLHLKHMLYIIDVMLQAMLFCWVTYEW